MASSTPHLGAYRNLTDKFMKYRERYRSGSGLGALPPRDRHPRGRAASSVRASSRRAPPPTAPRSPSLTPLARRLSGFGGASERSREAASTRLLEAAIGSSSSMGVGNEGAGLEGLSATLPPAWVDFSEEATSDIQRIREKLKELSAAHAKALLPNFDDMGTDDHVVEVVTQETTRLFKRCEARLQRLGAGIERRSPDDERVVKNVQRRLATELQRLSQVFRKAQKEYLQRLKQQQDRGPGGAGVDDVFRLDAVGLSTSGDAGWGDASRDRDAYDPGFTDVQLQRVDRGETMSFERDQEVMKILESVNDLAGVMKDLSVLIIDQGSVLDRIDYNCEQVAVTVEEGRKQLVKAETHQKNSRMITCIYFLIVMIVVMTLVVIVQKM